MASFNYNTVSSTIHKTVGNWAHQLSIYGRILIPNITLQLLFCVWALPVRALFQVPPYNEIRDSPAMAKAVDCLQNAE
jgi:hypothetical protein